MNPTPMNLSPKERARRAFDHRAADRIVKAELWIGAPVLRRAALADDLAGHLALRRQLGMDILFLPLSDQPAVKAEPGYRRFSPADVAAAVDQGEFFVGVVLDGPLQRLVEERGLPAVFTDWAAGPDRMVERLIGASGPVLELTDTALKLKVQAVVMAEDLAWQKGPYFKPAEIRPYLRRFYSDFARLVQEGGAKALMHSCGNIMAFLDDLSAAGLDGLAGAQIECLDAIGIKKEYGRKLTLLTGLPAFLLDHDDPDEAAWSGFRNTVRRLSEGNGFILGSSTGLYAGAHLERLERLYLIAEEAISRRDE
ncbi:MAG: hypothetical protein AB1641_22635 [Thermodesulfobacteriota bacterium]